MRLQHGFDQPRAPIPHGCLELADEFVSRHGARRLDSEAFGQFDKIRLRVSQVEQVR